MKKHILQFNIVKGDNFYVAQEVDLPVVTCSISRFNLEIEQLPKGYHIATSKNVQMLVAQTKTFEKTVEIADFLNV